MKCLNVLLMIILILCVQSGIKSILILVKMDEFTMLQQSTINIYFKTKKTYLSMCTVGVGKKIERKPLRGFGAWAAQAIKNACILNLGQSSFTKKIIPFDTKLRFFGLFPVRVACVSLFCPCFGDRKVFLPS